MIISSVRSDVVRSLKYSGIQYHVEWMKSADNFRQGYDLNYRTFLNIQALRSSEKLGNFYKNSGQIRVGPVLTEK
jgi:hypothetical protein